MFISKNENQIKISSDKNFGITFGIIFFIIYFYPLLNENKLNIIYLLIGIVFFITSFSFPKIFKYPNIFWCKFGIFLSKIINPIILTFLYFFLITPIGVLMKLIYNYRKVNYLIIDKKILSYWIVRKDDINSFKDQF